MAPKSSEQRRLLKAAPFPGCARGPLLPKSRHVASSPAAAEHRAPWRDSSSDGRARPGDAAAHLACTAPLEAIDQQYFQPLVGRLQRGTGTRNR